MTRGSDKTGGTGLKRVAAFLAFMLIVSFFAFSTGCGKKAPPVPPDEAAFFSGR